MNKQLRFYQENGKTFVTLAKSEKPEDYLCDFCSRHEEPFRHYDTNDFDVDAENRSVGGFLACPKCAALIDANDKEALLARSLITNPTGIPADEAMPMIRQIHNQFFDNLKTTK